MWRNLKFIEVVLQNLIYISSILTLRTLYITLVVAFAHKFSYILDVCKTSRRFDEICLFAAKTDFHGSRVSRERERPVYNTALEITVGAQQRRVGTRINPKSLSSTAGCRSLHAKCHAYTRSDSYAAAKFETRHYGLAMRAGITFRSCVPAPSRIRGFQCH